MSKSIFLKAENVYIEVLIVVMAVLVAAFGLSAWFGDTNTNSDFSSSNSGTSSKERVLGTATRTFYIDATNGSDGNAGTSVAGPFKTMDRISSLTLQPGDHILFKSGQTHSTSTNLTVFASGNAESPIVVSSYGSGEKPKLQSTQTGQYDGVMNIVGAHVHIKGLHFVTPSDEKTEAGLRLKGQSQLVEDSEFNGIGHGIEVLGATDITVRNNYFHNLEMIVNDTVPDNDRGAVGVLVGDSSNVELYNNRFENIQPASIDYGRDGTALETYDNASNVYFYRNYVENVDNFSEIGGSSPSKLAQNIYYHNNVIVNPRGGLYIHLAGTNTNFGLSVKNVRFDHNTVYRDRTDANTSFFFGFSGAPGADTLYVRNNIFKVANLSNFYYNPGTSQHSHNVYALTNVANLGVTLASSESLAEPSFSNLGSRDFSLASGSVGIDSGADLAYPTDFLGAQRKIGSAVDLGAYEYVQAAATSCKADYTGDGKVNLNDLSVFAANYSKPAIACSLDLSGTDCKLTSEDFAYFKSEYKICGS